MAYGTLLTRIAAYTRVVKNNDHTYYCAEDSLISERMLHIRTYMHCAHETLLGAVQDKKLAS